MATPDDLGDFAGSRDDVSQTLIVGATHSTIASRRMPRSRSRSAPADTTSTLQPSSSRRPSFETQQIEERTSAFEVDEEVDVARRTVFTSCYRSEHRHRQALVQLDDLDDGLAMSLGQGAESGCGERHPHSLRARGERIATLRGVDTVVGAVHVWVAVGRKSKVTPMLRFVSLVCDQSQWSSARELCADRVFPGQESPYFCTGAEHWQIWAVIPDPRRLPGRAIGGSVRIIHPSAEVSPSTFRPEASGRSR